MTSSWSASARGSSVAADGPAWVPSPRRWAEVEPLGQPTAELASYAALGSEPLLLVRSQPGDGSLVLAWCNEAFTALTGYSVEHLQGRPFEMLENPGEAGAAPRSRASRGRGWMHGSAEVLRTLERRDGSRLRVSIRAVPVGPGDAPAWVLGLRVSSDGLRADERLRASEDRFRALAEQAPVGIFSSDVGLRLGYVNARMAALLGRPASDCLGMDWLARLHPEDVGRVVDALHSVLLGKAVELPVRLCPSPDVLRWVDVSVVPVTAPDRGAGFVGTMLDVTDRRALELRLHHQATHDPLTGLANRSLLLDRTETALAEREGGEAVALFFLDLDDFKLVNDSLGHDSGDELLEQMAHRLVLQVREGDLVARVGGDEFVVLCSRLRDENEALRVASRLSAAVAAPLELGGHEMRVSASIGVVLANDGASSATDLLRDADVAMYQAKSGGKEGVAVFDLAVRSRLTDRLHLINDLRRAVESGQLFVVYQPVLSLDGDRVDSIEALVRWRHPTRGMVPPCDFIPLAEQSSLIERLGADVLRTACLELASLRRELGDDAPTSVSVNLSAVQLRSPVLPEIVAGCLAESGLRGEDVCLELTESVLMSDPVLAAEQLQTLRHLGVSVAIDDFGTGYSSLAYLHQLPVDRLKIDRSLLAGLGDAEGRCVAPAAVALADGLGLESVAEGVETGPQLEALRELGCSHVQGYHVCRPLPPDQLRTWLLDHARTPAPRRATP